MLLQEVRDERGDQQRSSAARGLELLAVAPPVADLFERSDDAHATSGEIEVHPLQPGELAPAGAKIGTRVDERLVAGTDR